MKYFVLGALASGMLLYGLSMIYGATGSLDIDTVARAIYGRHGNGTLLTFGLVFVVSGIAFKLGVVAVSHVGARRVRRRADGDHAPDRHRAEDRRLRDDAAHPVRRAAGRRVRLAGHADRAVACCRWCSATSSPSRRSNIKRMLAYSTIANMGYMLLGFLTANRNGFSAAMFYTISYVLTSLASFGMIMLLSREGFESDQLDDFKGLNQRSPWWAFIMLLVMFSLAGLPPTIGFYAKFMVIEAAVNEGFVWLAVVAVITSLIGAFYYLRIVKLMYFDEPVETIADRRPRRHVARCCRPTACCCSSSASCRSS